MTPIVATFKPKSVRDWSYYSCLLLQGSTDPKRGVWKWLRGPFFPFCLAAPMAKKGTWSYAPSGTLYFFTTTPEDDPDGDLIGVMMFAKVHWNFQILCSQRALQGKGAQKIAQGVQILEAEKLIWLMGPTEGKKKSNDDRLSDFECFNRDSPTDCQKKSYDAVPTEDKEISYDAWMSEFECANRDSPTDCK
jgi:hypothetical protein